MLNSKRVFVLSPHADDAEICCGGTIARLVENKAEVYLHVFAKPEEREKELERSLTLMGIKQCFLYNIPIRNFDKHRQLILNKLIIRKEKLKPDLVIQPSLTDLHQDHGVIAHEGVRAFKDVNLYGFETPWNNLTFEAQMFVRLDLKHLTKKVDAVKCYKSQSHKSYISNNYIVSLARVRGVQIGFKYAEMFSVIRQIVR